MDLYIEEPEKEVSIEERIIELLESIEWFLENGVKTYENEW